MAAQLELYRDCITKQLEEVDMLSSIYCAPGEMHIFDAGVISDFNEFLQHSNKEKAPLLLLKSRLDYNVKLELQAVKCKTTLDVRIELPHLYPILENALVTVHTPLLCKNKESYLKTKIENFINTMDKTETYIFQVLSWLQDQIEDLLERDNSEYIIGVAMNLVQDVVDFERLWIYSHHIKSKTKRQEIIKQARNMGLSGFSRPGKPGIICVEGLKEYTQDFWRIIKSMHWQKISICKIESNRKPQEELNKLRRFEGFKELLFCDNMKNEEGVMDMGLFLKYLEMHNSAYMKKELFGLD